MRASGQVSDTAEEGRQGMLGRPRKGRGTLGLIRRFRTNAVVVDQWPDGGRRLVGEGEESQRRSAALAAERPDMGGIDGGGRVVCMMRCGHM